MEKSSPPLNQGAENSGVVILPDSTEIDFLRSEKTGVYLFTARKQVSSIGDLLDAAIMLSGQKKRTNYVCFIWPICNG